MYTIAVTRKIPEVGLALLKKNKKLRLRVSPHDRVLTRHELLAMANGADAILAQLIDKIDAGVLNAAGPQLKIIANYAVGYDNIDLAACKKRNIVVTNTPGVLSQAVAEHTIALIMAVTKRIVEGDAYSRAGKYKGWTPFLLLGPELRGKTIGIIGTGRIGTLVAEFAVRGLGMKLIYSDLNRNAELEKNLGAKKVDLQTLLRQTDVVSLHVPLMLSTHHLISKKQLAMMKRTAYLVNTSRGPVVDERALVVALRTRRIAGAAIDVWEFEPKLATGLTALPNVVITPHMASATFEARDAMGVLASENIIAVLSGKPAKTPIEMR